ncbi:hypothetical protein [Vannielia litorea]|uniref:hypothetical protein n=1 Tax=Vannielia litorea TaxID=1217970 RepID=UPI0015880D10|nr:hypothetical protein [Vannielia litorea]
MASEVAPGAVERKAGRGLSVASLRSAGQGLLGCASSARQAGRLPLRASARLS